MRVRGMEQELAEFAEFYESTREDCLRIVLLNVGDRQLAQDLVAEAYTRAWVSWRKVRALDVPQADPGLFTSIYHAQKGASSGNTVLVIHPSALPSGAGVQIGASPDGRAGDRGPHQVAGNQTVHNIARQPVHQVAARADNSVLRVGLVYTSQQCTGS
jgi:hypothetical protein